MSWQKLEEGNQELADFGKQRFTSRVAYLGTIRKDGSPRVHPVTPFIVNGNLFIGMYPTSPKGHDLRRDSRFALHCSVEDDEGGGGEFAISGHAQVIEDPELRRLATEHAPYELLEDHVLFMLSVQRALSTVYVENETRRTRWKAESSSRGGLDGIQ
jgi:hypothetical protein